MNIIRTTNKMFGIVSLAVVVAASVLVFSPKSASAAPSYGIGSCAWMDVSVQQGSRGDCVKAVQAFLRHTIDGRGYGPICPGVNLNGPIVVDGQAGPQTTSYIRCYQTMVNNFDNSNRYPYNGQRLTVDGVAGRQTYSRMILTCKHDSRYLLGPEDRDGNSYFKNKWFCVR